MSKGEIEKQGKGKRKRKVLEFNEFSVQLSVLDIETIADMFGDEDESTHAKAVFIRFSKWLNAGGGVLPDLGGLSTLGKSILKRLCASHSAKWEHYIRNNQAHRAPVSAPEDGGVVSVADGGGVRRDASAPDDAGVPKMDFDAFCTMCEGLGISDYGFIEDLHGQLERVGWKTKDGVQIKNLKRYVNRAWRNKRQEQDGAPSVEIPKREDFIKYITEIGLDKNVAAEVWDVLNKYDWKDPTGELIVDGTRYGTELVKKYQGKREHSARLMAARGAPDGV